MTATLKLPDYGTLYDRAMLHASDPEPRRPLCLRMTREAYVEHMAAQAAFEAEYRARREAARAAAAAAVEERTHVAGKADAAAKARHDEAVRYVADYRGTWGLPLDIKADRKWGTKYLKLTERQVEALLAGKARDAAAAATVVLHPRYAEAVAILEAWTPEQVRGNDFRQAMVLRHGGNGTLTHNMVEAILRSAPTPKAPEAPAAPEITEGMWLLGDTIVKVQRALATGTGQLYAKRLNPETGDFLYEAGLIRKLAGAVKMTLEQAGQFGLLYGRCIRCGRTLTDEYSIANGIGKVCAGKGEWA
jgi:hypothetical protein